MSSRDVIHSFYVPSFRVKSDVVPGRTMTVWFEAKTPGRYPIWCAEYCGVSHSRMLGEVVVLGARGLRGRGRGRTARIFPTASDRRLRQRPRLVLEWRSSSRAAARSRCAARASRATRTTASGMSAPSWRGLYEADRRAHRRKARRRERGVPHALDDGSRTPTSSRATPPIMPTYRGTLTAGEAGALVEYIKSLQGTVDVPDAGVVLPALDGGAP